MRKEKTHVLPAQTEEAILHESTGDTIATPDNVFTVRKKSMHGGPEHAAANPAVASSDSGDPAPPPPPQQPASGTSSLSGNSAENRSPSPSDRQHHLDDEPTLTE